MTVPLWLAVIAAFASFVLPCGPGHAGTPSPALPSAEELQHRFAHSFTIQDMIAYAYSQNPDIAADRAAWRAKTGRLPHRLQGCRTPN